MSKSKGVASGGTGMRRTLSIWNFFTIGFGIIVGTGWVLLIGDWMVIGGGPIAAMITLLIDAIFLLPVGTVFEELTAAAPISGGIIEYVDRAYGNNMSYITGWFLALENGILCPWEAIAISMLVSDMFGGLFPILRAVKPYTTIRADVHPFPTAVALGFVFCVISLNFRGASAAAKLQAFLTEALLTSMLLAMDISFIKGGPSNILSAFSKTTGPSSTTSVNSVFAEAIPMLVMTPFFYAGFDTTPQQAKEAAGGLDWNKFGRVISMALLIAGGFYTICIYSFGTIIPWTGFVRSTVPVLACLKNINMVLYMAILIIATLGSVGPMSSFYGAINRIMLAMGRKGQFPPSFAEINGKNGAPKVTNMVLAVLTVMGPFLGKNILVSLTNVSALVFVFSYTMVNFTYLEVRKTEPDLPHPYKVPGGKLGISMACLAGGIITALMIVPSNPAALKPVEWAIMTGWLVVDLILKAVSSKESA